MSRPPPNAAAKLFWLAKILGMLGSNQDGEVLSAARAAEEMRQRANLTWEDLLGVA